MLYNKAILAILLGVVHKSPILLILYFFNVYLDFHEPVHLAHHCLTSKSTLLINFDNSPISKFF